jgi:RNA polymerase sigma-70 factor (ECF subfamily)
VHEPFAIAMLDVADGRIVGVSNYLYPELFPALGLPARLES